MLQYSRIFVKTILNNYLKIIFIFVYTKYGYTLEYNDEHTVKLFKRQNAQTTISTEQNSAQGNSSVDPSTDPLAPETPCVVSGLPLIQIILLVILFLLIVWAIVYRGFEHTKVVPIPATYGHNTNSMNVAAMYYCQIQFKTAYENNQFQRMGMIFTYSDIGRHQKLVLDKYFLHSLRMQSPQKQYLTFFFYTDEIIYRLMHLNLVHDGRSPVLVESVELQNVDTPFRQTCYIRGPTYNEFHELSKKTYPFESEKVQIVDKMYRVPRNVTLIETSIFFLTFITIGVLIITFTLSFVCSDKTPCFANQQKVIGINVGLICFLIFLFYTMSFWKYVRFSLHFWFGRCLAFYTRYLWIITSISSKYIRS